MKPITFALSASILLPLAGPDPARAQPAAPASDIVVRLDDATPRPPFAFDADDEAFLEEIQRGAFNFLWDRVGSAGMVYDRTGSDAVSVAGVGFQLTGIAIGVERRWITREQGEARSLQIVRALADEPTNRKDGLFYHFVHPDTAHAGEGIGYEAVVSTIDSALLFAGLLTASSYFGGEVAEVADRLVREADWTLAVAGGDAPPEARGLLSLAWKPEDPADPTGEGEIVPFYWLDSGDEHLLVTFLAVAAPDAAHALPPEAYYRLRRRLGRQGDIGPYVWFPWSGALFTNCFAHCWINYASIGADDPSRWDVGPRPSVDWWSNTAMAVRMHRAKAIENPMGFEGFGEHGWGLTACDYADGYLVPELFPDEDVPLPGARPGLDVSVERLPDKWGDGTLAPYGAGMAIMFEPGHAVAALRHYRSLAGRPGMGAIWSDPSIGGWGFADSFNLTTGWVSPERFAIDQGPMLLAIENARTGFVWEWFHRHPWVRAGVERLGLELGRGAGEPDANRGRIGPE